MKLTETDEIIGRKDLIEKWIKDRKKEETLINVSDIILEERVHKAEFRGGVAKDKTEVKGIIIVRPAFMNEGKFVLVRGWVLYQMALKINQEKIRAYITHTGRKKFAQKLLRYEETANIND